MKFKLPVLLPRFDFQVTASSSSPNRKLTKLKLWRRTHCHCHY